MGIFTKKKTEDINDSESANWRKKTSKKKAISVDSKEIKETGEIKETKAKKESKETESVKTEENKKGKIDKAKEKKEVSLDGAKSILVERTIIKPLISEKAGTLAMAGKYIFKVNKGAPKQKIKDAIESLYKISVINVNVVNIPGKPKQSKSRRIVHRADYRKAIVTLKPGEKIEIYQ